MARYIGLRLVRMVTVVFAVTVLSFLLLNLIPGSPVDAVLGPAAGDPAARAQVTKQLGLNHPIYYRYWLWLNHALHGNLGTSYITQQNVTHAILEHLPFTIELMILAEIIALVLAVPAAMYCSLHEDRWFDRVVNPLNLVFLALPAFMLGEVLIYIFSVKLDVVQASGFSTWFTMGSGLSPAVVPTPQSIIMPAFALAAGQFAFFTRLLRGDLITTLKSDFVLMARSKGFKPWGVLLRHALKPSSFTLVSVVGLSVGGLITGALVVEQVFGLPGVGTLLVGSIETKDYLMVQGLVVLVAVGFVTINFVTDMLYGVLDPRIRRARLIG